MIPWVVVGLVVIVGLARSSRRQPSTLDHNDATAELAVQALARCLVDERAAHPGRGFPSSLEDAGGTRHACAPAGLVNGRTATHRLAYLPGLPGREGLVTAFTLCAEPLAFGKTGRDTIVAEAPAHAPYSADAFWAHARRPQRQLGGPRPLSCSDAWSMDGSLDTAIRHCAFLYAASHPALGYPSRISEMVGPEGACLSVTDGTLSVSRDVVAWERTGTVTRLAYLPETPDGSGRTTAFEIHTVGPFDQWSDESGTEHRGVTREQRLWNATTMEERVGLRVGVDFVANVPRLEKECWAGRASSCADLGDALFLEMHPRYQTGAPWGRVASAYRQACEAGVSLGCLRVFELVEYLQELQKIVGVGHAALDVEPIACSFLDRGCVIEPGEACWKGVLALESGTCPAGSGPSLDERIERACRTQRPGACRALGERYLAHGGRAWGFGEVAPLLDVACHSTDPAACAALGRMLLARPSEPQAGPRARQLFRRACALAEEATACDAMADGVPPG